MDIKLTEKLDQIQAPRLKPIQPSLEELEQLGDFQLDGSNPAISQQQPLEPFCIEMSRREGYSSMEQKTVKAKRKSLNCCKQQVYYSLEGGMFSEWVGVDRISKRVKFELL